MTPWSTPRKLRRLRQVALLSFIGSVLIWPLTARHEAGYHIGNGIFIAVGNACFQAGFNVERFTSQFNLEPGFYAAQGWHTDWAIAWRPFHAAQGWNTGGARNWDFIVVPLWPLMPLSGMLLGYAHGSLATLRRIRASQCLTCDYDLSAIPAPRGRSTCPECGSISRQSAL